MAQRLHDVSGIHIGTPADPLPLSDRRNRVMWLNNDRVFYAGLLGAVSTRTMGGWLVYASLGAPLRSSSPMAARSQGSPSLQLVQ